MKEIIQDTIKYLEELISSVYVDLWYCNHSKIPCYEWYDQLVDELRELRRRLNRIGGNRMYDIM